MVLQWCTGYGSNRLSNNVNKMLKRWPLSSDCSKADNRVILSIFQLDGTWSVQGKQIIPKQHLHRWFKIELYWVESLEITTEWSVKRSYLMMMENLYDRNLYSFYFISFVFWYFQHLGNKRSASLGVSIRNMKPQYHKTSYLTYLQNAGVGLIGALISSHFGCALQGTGLLPDSTW